MTERLTILWFSARSAGQQVCYRDAIFFRPCFGRRNARVCADAVAIAASAIEEAYSDEIRELFKVLFTNLIDSPGSDQQSAAKFAAGLNRAKRARDLALAAIATASAQTRALRRPKQGRKKMASR